MGLIIPKPQSFTVHYDGRARVLGTFLDVFEAFDPDESSIQPNGKTYQAIWDTGASGSVITKRVVQDLGLKPIGKIQSKGVHGEAKIVNAYLVNLRLPNTVGIVGLKVGECEELGGPFDVLIGMDIIGLGDFAVTSDEGKTVLSFRMPATNKIDFVKEPPLSRQQRRKIARDKEKKRLKK